MNGAKKTLFIIWICVCVFISPSPPPPPLSLSVSFPHHSFCVCHVYALMLSDCVLFCLILNLFATIVNFELQLASALLNTPKQNNTNFKLTQVNQHLCVFFLIRAPYAFVLFFQKEIRMWLCVKGLIAWRSTQTLGVDQIGTKEAFLNVIFSFRKEGEDKMKLKKKQRKVKKRREKEQKHGEERWNANRRTWWREWGRLMGKIELNKRQT